MKDRLKDWQGHAVSPLTGKPQAAPAPDAVKDAVSALISLGYKPQEASRMVSHVESEGLASEEIIRLALKSSVKV
jgi:Holliday junction DNA helicase RuvA